MPRLVSISWRNAPGLPGLRPSSLQTFDVGQRGGFYDDWRVIVDGPVILLVSPIGWTPQEYNKRHQVGERCVYELPRKDAALR